jgi:hypothetical protein
VLHATLAHACKLQKYFGEYVHTVCNGLYFLNIATVFGISQLFWRAYLHRPPTPVLPNNQDEGGDETVNNVTESNGKSGNTFQTMIKLSSN